MSVTRSPRLNDIRRREEISDRRKVASIIMALVAFGLFCTIAAMIWVPVLK